MSKSAAPNSPWRRGLQVVMAAWFVRTKGRLPWLQMGVAGVLGMLVLISSVGGVMGLQKQWRMLATVAASVVLLLAWMRLVMSALQQNHPSLARLVPHQVRSLQQVLQVVLGLISVGLGLLIGALVGRPVLWSAVTALVMLYLPSWIRWPVQASVTMACGLVLVFATDQSVAIKAGIGQLAEWADAHAALSACLAAVAALSLARAVLDRAVSSGNAQHARRYQLLRQTYIKDGVMMAGPLNLSHIERQGGGVGLGSWSARLYRRYFDRAVMRGVTAPVGVRLALGLGPGLHWTWTLANWLFACLPCLALALLARVLPDVEMLQVMAASMPWGVAIGATFAGLSLPGRLYDGRREQALFRLLPGAPQGQALNRWFGWRLISPLLAIGGVTLTLALMARALLSIDSLPGFFLRNDAIMAVCLMPFLSIPFVLRDWSRVKPQGSGVSLTMALENLVMLPVAIVWTMVLHWSLWLFALLVLCLAIMLFIWRWRFISRAPAALPVGRLA